MVVVYGIFKCKEKADQQLNRQGKNRRKQTPLYEADSINGRTTEKRWRRWCL
jgi:hypothetical protein